MHSKLLTSRDAIVTNAAAVHYHTHKGNFSKVVEFITEKSALTNATFFWLEPTPSEWPTSNGIYQSGIATHNPGSSFCPCQVLTDSQLLGNESNFTCENAINVYTNLRANDPNNILKVPNTWRTDLVRDAIKKSNNTKINLVPIYWQLVSKDGGSYRRDGDCSHKDLYSTIAMLFQLARAAIGLQTDK